MTPRNSDRVRVVFPIRGIGSDTDGSRFEAAGRTVAISRNGAAIVLNHQLIEGQEITIRRLDTGKETKVRVLNPMGGQGRETIYGIAFINPAANLWNVEFPQLSGLEEPLARMLLRCEVCGGLEVVHLDEVDVQVFERNQQIGRFCKSCSTMTSWRQTSSKAKSDSSPLQERHTFQEKGESNSSHEKRKHNRVRTTVSACVRKLGREDEIVACENLSRGGLCFRSRNPYAQGDEIEVAVSYVEGSGNIFSRARIAHVKEIKEGFRCGVAYITVEKKYQGYDGSPCEVTKTP